MKKLNFSIKILTALVLSLFAASCDNNDDAIDDLAVYSANINGSVLDEGISNIPLDGSIALAFSHNLQAEELAQAFSLADSQGEANYEIILGNAASKAIINYSGLNPGSSYTVSMNTGSFGKNGEALTESFSRSFTTTSEVEETKNPCTTATQECIQTIEITEGFSFEFYSSFDIISDGDYVWEDITEVVFSVHGQNRDADEYFKYMTNAVDNAGILESTLVISPYFKDEASASAGDLFWDANWREGAVSANSDADVSSFSVLDKIIDYLANSEKFPNLTKITVAGHSSGAALTQHYAISNTSETDHAGFEFQYVVANNQYFYYPDGRRYNESISEFYTPTDCTGYDFWPYGYETAPAYVSGMTQEDLLQLQISRNTVYLLGTNDTETEGTLNTTDCAAVLLGSNRLERGRNIFNYFETFYPDNNQEKIEVEGIGHDASAMFNSDEFKSLLTN